MLQMRQSVPLASISAPMEYDAIYLPGGHGAMWDMPGDAKLQQILQDAWAAGKIIATVCHGPAGLVGVVDKQSGQPLVFGKKMTCFSDTEEMAMQLMGKTVPFKLESKLRDLGAEVSTAALPMTSCVQRDGRLLSGQNPSSVHKLCHTLIEALNELKGLPQAAAA